MAEVAGNRIWLDGIELAVVSGDVSAIEESLRKKLDEGGGWVYISGEHVNHTVRLTPTTSVVIQYAR